MPRQPPLHRATRWQLVCCQPGAPRTALRDRETPAWAHWLPATGPPTTRPRAPPLEVRSERLLKSLYYVTLRHGTKSPAEIQGLWTQLAKRTRNINPILDFLLHLGMAIAEQVRCVCGSSPTADV